MKQFISLPKLSRGDKVAILSPSSGLPQIFPHVYELGLERLRDVFGLEPVEYPTTRIMGASLRERAADVTAAFRDKEIKAVFTSIGGEDQLQLLKHLDPQVFTDNPKPFFGYSDNTHIHNYLWNLGIPSYYGGAIMTTFAMNGQMFDMSVDTLNRALFDGGEYVVTGSDIYSDIGLEWADIDNLSKQRVLERNEGIKWDGRGNVAGILWGGCVESLIFQMAAGKYLPKDDDLNGVVLYIETAEDIPESWIPSYLLRGMGERGWFDRFNAVLVGRPKAWERDKQNDPQQKIEYRAEQREAVLKAIRHYNDSIPVIQNLDFGHTDPQLILPSGGRVAIDVDAKSIALSF